MVGSRGANGSGDLFVCFATANRVSQRRVIHRVRMMDPACMDDLFEAAVEATEEAILNALAMAETMQGRQGRIAHALPLDRVAKILGARSVVGRVSRKA